jgi:small subunit ribosomal protein S16
MLKIRLARVGKKHFPFFRVVLTEDSAPAKSNFIEVLGHYSPLTKKLVVKKERILYWLKIGAKPSESLHNRLVDEGIIEGKKLKRPTFKKKEKKEAKGELKAENKEVSTQATEENKE